MTPVGFEPTISAVEPPKTYALDRTATGTGRVRRIANSILVAKVSWAALCKNLVIEGATQHLLQTSTLHYWSTNTYQRKHKLLIQRHIKLYLVVQNHSTDQTVSDSLIFKSLRPLAPCSWSWFITHVHRTIGYIIINWYCSSWCSSGKWRGGQKIANQRRDLR